jgi:hypothetical protein
MTELQFSQLAHPLRWPVTGAYPGARMARRVLVSGVSSDNGHSSDERKVVVGCGREDRQSSATKGCAFAACA